MTTRQRQILLFVAGIGFASLLMHPSPATPLDTAANGIALWLSFYPFALTTRIGAGYWGMLVIGLPVAVVARHYSGGAQPALQVGTLALLAASLATITVRFFTRRRAKQ